MPQTHVTRRDRLRAALATADLPALLVTRLVNVAYLSGFTGSAGALLVTHDEVALATDGRYTTQAGQQAGDVELMVTRDAPAVLAGRAATAGVHRLGFEAHDVTVEAHAALVAAAPGVELRDAHRVVEGLRTVKDDDELAALARACQAADAALAGLLARGGLTGRSELAIARDLEAGMLAAGATGPAFPSIVAAGENSAIPHHRPTERVVGRGELVKMDFGAVVDGYHSDMTRTYVTAPVADWQAELHALVAAAAEVGRAALHPGVCARDVDARAREVIAAAGYAENFPHALGHGVGLEVHEAPTLGYGNSATVGDHTPVTVEPGVYLPGRGGVRIEDVCVVTAEGPARVLTTSVRDLLSC